MQNKTDWSKVPPYTKVRLIKGSRSLFVGQEGEWIGGASSAAEFSTGIYFFGSIEDDWLELMEEIPGDVNNPVILPQPTPLPPEPLRPCITTFCPGLQRWEPTSDGLIRHCRSCGRWYPE